MQDPTERELERKKQLREQIRDNYLRPIARASKSTAKGFGSIFDFVNLPINIGLNLAGYPELPSVSDSIGATFDEATGGLTTPLNNFERGIDTAGEFVAGGGPFALAGKVSKAANFFAPKNLLELASFAGAGAGTEVARQQAPNSILAQLAGGMAGAIAPNAIPSVAKGALSPVKASQNLIASALKVDPNKAKAFSKAGLNPTLADISNSKVVKGTQNILAEAPFTSSIINDAIHKTNNRIANLDRGLTTTQTGELAQKGGKSYITKGNELTSKLKNLWMNDIIPSEKMQLNKSSAVFSKKLNVFEPESIKAHENSQVGSLYKELQNIAERNDGKIPVGDAMNYMQRIDNLVSTYGSMGGPEQGQLKYLRGKLNEDIKDFAYSKGSKIRQAFDRYNKFYTQYRTKLDEKILPLVENKTATEAFNSIKNDLRIDAKKADAILSTLKPAEKEIFSESILRELGMSPQNDFNPSYLASNFKKLEPIAQEVVLSGMPKEAQKQFRATIDAIDYMKGTKSQGNPSGTFNQLFKLGVFGALLTEPITTSASLGSAIGSAKLMTNPKFLNWLSKADSIKNDTQAAKHINGLSKIASSSPEIANAIKQYTQNLQNEGLEAKYNAMPLEDLEKLLRDSSPAVPTYTEDDLMNMPLEEIEDYYKTLR